MSGTKGYLQRSRVRVLTAQSGFWQHERDLCTIGEVVFI